MKHLFIALFFFLILCPAFGQNNIVKTAGVSYTAGPPTFTPGRTGSQVAIDTVTGFWYEHNGTSWSASGYRVQTISGCAAPAYTPAKYQSRLVINACTAGQGGPELYYYTGSVWLQINEGQTYTAGTGIDITGTTITNTAPNVAQTLSIAGQDLTLSGGGGTVAIPNNDLWTDAGAFAYLTATVDRVLVGGSTEVNSSYLFQANGSAIFNGNIAMPATTSSAGSILVNGQRAAHLYNSNTFLGILSGNYTHTGTGNTGIGQNALPSLTSGSQNTAVGFESAPLIAGGTSNTSIGYRTLYKTTSGGNNVALGVQALKENISGNSNMAIGFQTLQNSTSPDANIAIGSSVMQNGTGSPSQNTAIGTYAMLAATGNNNIAIGASALQSITSGGNNTSVGKSSGFSMATATGNVFLGYNSGYSETGSNKLYIENSNSGAPLIGGDFSTNRVGINVAPGSINATLQVSGSTGYSQFNLATTYTPSGSADALGSNGDFAYDSNYIYVKVGGSWKRAALSTF